MDARSPRPSTGQNAAPAGTAPAQNSAAPAAARAQTRPSAPDFAAFRNPQLARELIAAINRTVAETGRPLNLMEVCGTHTMSIGRYGFRSVMPEGLTLLSGPGCPVCVTANEDIDRAIALARIPGVTVTTFGDMMRVPGSSTTLSAEKAAGRDVRMVYSPLDALDLAEREPERQVAFIAVGFETTAPAIAATILEAQARSLANFSVFCAHKTTPAALRAIADDPATNIDGFILPGHVSTITGLAPYRFLVDEFHIPGVVTGFEPVDILTSIELLCRMAARGEARIENAYQRGVAQNGNPVARALVEQVFEPCDAVWRGLGMLPASGLAVRPEFARFDARRRFSAELEALAEPVREPAGCRCGDVLRGAIAPSACPLFGRACTPEHPVGPCMVSSEGSCAAYWRYRE